MLKGPRWLRDAVLYQVYPQSFKDSNGDGIGDLPGITASLDYLEWLGVNVIWISPCFVSPFQDAGYDIADHYKVASRYGTNADLQRLIRAAHSRDMRVCLDLVPGHTSIEHPWFKASCRHKRNQYSDRYVWTDSGWKQAPNLDSIRGYSERNGAYIANFLYCQPAPNYGFAKPDPKHPWQQPVSAPGPMATRQELRRLMDFWLKRGIDGFRVDMASSLVKNDPDARQTSRLWREIRAWLDTQHPEAVLISEWGDPVRSLSAGFHIDYPLLGNRYYMSLLRAEPRRVLVVPPLGHSFFDRCGRGNIREFLDEYLRLLRATRGRGHISLPSSNHDMVRVSCDRNVADLKVIYTMLLTMPGVPFIYQGDEIGMRHLRNLPSKEGSLDRTGCRTPMQWDRSRNAGFSSAPARKLYLPCDPNANRPTVADQMSDPHSLLQHIRNLIALRRRVPALQADGEFRPLYARANALPFVYARILGKDRFVVALNPSAAPAAAVFPFSPGGTVETVMASGAQLDLKTGRAKIAMKGVSYGVFAVTRPAGGGKSADSSAAARPACS
ncbi:MAG: alpha-amylase family glycosyl hydrolase [Kiritimatiellae bacterium]|nr:alpha-amylase family glycosyl hydrolase [Kiritimatiellia bacterium]